MAKIRVIETGGTFSMGRNDQGLLVPRYTLIHYALTVAIQQSDQLAPSVKEQYLSDLTTFDAMECGNLLSKIRSGTTIEALLENYGILPEVRRPYFIDSIDFSFTTHYPLLVRAIEEELEQQHVVIVIGGTDTLEFYGPAIAKDPYLATKYPNATILFLSAMYPFVDRPDAIGSILDAALLTTQASVKGAYAITAKDEAHNAFIVHDLSQHFSKISSQMAHAFRSNDPIGTIEGRELTLVRDKSNISTQIGWDQSSRQMSLIAPPLIVGNQLEAIISYMECLFEHAVIIEWGASNTCFVSSSAGLAQRLVELVKERAQRGVITCFVNDHAYSQETDTLKPIIDELNWGSSSFLESVKEAGGAVISDATTIGVYLDIWHGHLKLEPVESEVKPTCRKEMQLAKMPVIGLMYVPDTASFNLGMLLAASIAKDIVLRTLPGGSVPERHLNIVETCGSTVHAGSKYNGSHYYSAGKTFVEGDKQNGYAASQAVGAVTRATNVPPSTQLRRILSSSGHTDEYAIVHA